MSYLKTAVTLMDVARAAGVSKMTVSNVVNGKPGMSQQTRERVLEAIARTGFVANPAARVLAGRSMNLLGMILPSFDSSYLNEIVRGATAATEAAGFDLAIFTTSYHLNREHERATLLRSLADGVLLVKPLANEHQIFSNRIPVVTINADGPYTVRTDNIQGGRLAAQHLLELGHRRIAIFGFPRLPVGNEGGKVYVPRQDVQERQQSFLETLAAHGVAVLPECMLEVSADLNHDLTSGVPSLMQQLMNQPDPPSAIFALSDEIAFAVLQAASDLGVRVPEELSVVGFDNAPKASHMRPALTTVQQHLFEIGHTAATLLSELARGQTPPNPHPVLPTELIVRHSTAPPPANATVALGKNQLRRNHHRGGQN